MCRIFISYKRVDKQMVFPIKDIIESSTGEKCWIDLDGIESDAQFKDVIIKAINQCEIMLFMYSKQHLHIVDLEKDWTFKELNFAQKKNKRIVFVNIDGSPLSDQFEFDFGTKQQIDARNKERINKLITDIKKWFSIESFEIRKEKKAECEIAKINSINDNEKYNKNKQKSTRRYIVVLKDVGIYKLQIVKQIKDLLHWDLKETKKNVDSLPFVFPILFSQKQMEELFVPLSKMGGTLETYIVQHENLNKYNFIEITNINSNSSSLYEIEEKLKLSQLEILEYKKHLPVKLPIIFSEEEAIIQKFKMSDNDINIRILNKDVEKTPIAYRLLTCGPAKFQVVKAIKDTLDVDLKTAKRLVDNAPSTLATSNNAKDTEWFVKRLREAGAVIAIEYL